MTDEDAGPDGPVFGRLFDDAADLAVAPGRVDPAAIRRRAGTIRSRRMSIGAAGTSALALLALAGVPPLLAADAPPPPPIGVAAPEMRSWSACPQEHRLRSGRFDPTREERFDTEALSRALLCVYTEETRSRYVLTTSRELVRGADRVADSLNALTSHGPPRAVAPEDVCVGGDAPQYRIYLDYRDRAAQVIDIDLRCERSVFEGVALYGDLRPAIRPFQSAEHAPAPAASAAVIPGLPVTPSEPAGGQLPTTPPAQQGVVVPGIRLPAVTRS